VTETINNAMLDRFTLAHLAAGWIASRWFSLSLPLIAIGAIAFELVEDAAKDAWPHIFPHPSHDTKRNALADAGAVMLGALIEKRSDAG
jgi:hypothetical protein